MRRTRLCFCAQSLALLTVLSLSCSAATRPPRVLLVVAHPDDEYNFAATTYRMARELGGAVDEVVITDGEGGYRYSLLAEKIYGVHLTSEEAGREHLPAIRRQETLRAGRILGVRHHYFLNQKDQNFTLDPSLALNGAWDTKQISALLDHLLAHRRYDLVFTILPTQDTHGHHQAATILALQAVSRLPEEDRPVILGAAAVQHDQAAMRFPGRREYPLTATATDAPAFSFDRRNSFGYHDALNYAIVVNWMIAEYKSQGLFQTDTGKHDQESFWLFAVSGARGLSATAEFSEWLLPHTQLSVHRQQEWR